MALKKNFDTLCIKHVTLKTVFQKQTNYLKSKVTSPPQTMNGYTTIITFIMQELKLDTKL